MFRGNLFSDKRYDHKINVCAHFCVDSVHLRLECGHLVVNVSFSSFYKAHIDLKGVAN